MLQGNNQFVLKCIAEKASWCCAAADFVNSNRVQTECCTVSALRFKAAEPTAYTTARLASLARSSSNSPSTTTSNTVPSTSTSQTNVSTAGDSIPTTSSPSTTLGSNTFTFGPSSDDAPSGLSTTAKIGIGISVSICAVLLLLGVGVWWRRRRARERVQQHVAEMDGATMHELPKAPVELPQMPMAPVEMAAVEVARDKKAVFL